MRVSTRNVLMASAALALSFATPAFAPAALAGGGQHGGGGGGHGGCTHSCGGGGHYGRTPRITIHGPRINVGVNVNTNVNVNVNASAVANASAGAGAGARAGSGSTAIAIAGGGGGSFGAPPAATMISGLDVAGIAAYELVEEERTRWIEEWRVIRAVCVDDRGSPHPASRPDPNERVDAHFDGEIFRCMAGTYMQATIGWREDGRDRWDDAWTIVCQRGEALRHGAGGRVYCAQETAQRNCNERSLLRLYGPGLRLVHLRREERYTETVRRRTEYRETRTLTLMLDGGVGGYR